MFSMCKEERLAQAQENAAKAQDAPDKIKKIQDVIEKRGIDKEMLKGKYEKTIEDIDSYNNIYEEEMKQVFEKSQVLNSSHAVIRLYCIFSVNRKSATGVCAASLEEFPQTRRSFQLVEDERNLSRDEGRC